MTILCKESGLVLSANKSSNGIKIDQNTRLYNICRQMNRLLPAALVKSQDCLSNSA